MEATNGRRVHFNILATTTPKLLVGAGSRQALVIVNPSGVDMNLGYSGTLTNGVNLIAGTSFYDLFSSDEWWVSTSSSSGTICGYSVF